MTTGIDTISTLTVGELAALPASELMAMQAEATERLNDSKSLVAWIDGAIHQKYEQQVQRLREQHDKPTGVVRFEDEDIEIRATIAKRPQWDQHQLAQIAERVRVNGEDPLDYMSVTYKIPESKYQAWPPNLRSIFAEARTLAMGPQKFELRAKEVH